jgi:hypothetical protein
MLGKLRGRSFDELRTRGLQLAGTVAERLGHVPRPPRAAATARVALPFDASPAWGAAIAARWPAHVEAIRARADRLLAGRFDLLGFDALDAGDPPDWHRDPVAGRRADPDAHWSTIPFLDPDAVGDHKVIWELSRQQYLVTLAQAWRLTGEARYAQGAARLLAAWLGGNPPTRGINWASALEVAFRAIAWTWTLHLLADAPAPDAALRARAVASLDAHARHLERYLSTYFSPNTHLTGEALGLLYVGVACRELPRAARWRETGTRVLVEQATRQIRPDGTYFEQTTWYQHYTAEFYQHALALWDAEGTGIPDEVRERAARAADVVLHLLRPDGTIPRIGDDDGGRTLILDGARPGDFRDTPAVAAARGGRADVAAVIGELPPAAAWLLGPDGVRRYDALRAAAAAPPHPSRAFPDGGLHVLRDGWGGDASVLAVDAGRHGELTSGHSHADALAFDLVVRGRPALVDPGTYRYVGPERDRWRHASMHNTVTLDGASASQPDGWFRWRTVAHARPLAWADLGAVVCLVAEAEGWAERGAPATHRRVVLARRGEYWLVLDRVRAAGPFVLGVHFRGAAGLRGERCAVDQWRLHDGDGVLLDVRVTPGGAGALHSGTSAESGAFVEHDGWESRAYGARVAAPAAEWRAHGADAASVATLLAPGAADRRSSLWTIAADDAGWRLDGDGERHLVRDADGAYADGGLTLRGDCVWVRETGAGPVEFLVAAPAELTVPGARATPGAAWVAGRLAAGGWTLRGG